MSHRSGRLLAALASIALCTTAPPPLGAQGLGDAAGREKQKRQQRHDAESKPARTFTDEDLEAAKAAAKAAEAEPATGEAQASAGEGAGASADAAKGAADEAGADASQDPIERERHERALQRAEWRVRFANAREQLALAEAASWQEVVRTEFRAGIPVQMKIKEQVDTPELRRARKALADLEETFRRTGLPPGWARE